MAALLAWLLESIRSHGAWSVFVGVIIESVIAPIPSPLVIMGAGFLLIPPTLGAGEALRPILLQIVLPGAIGSTLGAYFGYLLGFWGGKALFERWSGFLGFGWGEVEAMERRFRQGQINALIFFLRALPVVPLSLISAAAGLLRLPAGQFGLWTLYGSIPRCLTLGYLGWWIGEAYSAWARQIDRMETAISVILLVGAVLALIWIRARVRSSLLGKSS
jgi:membrane protein DedA with SNARE-associated domain